MITEKHIILFDGECNFCSFWVKYVVKRDRKDTFRFASLQSKKGKGLLKGHKVDPSIDSVVLIEEGKHFVKSTAALRILKNLGGFRSVFYGLIIVPAFIRDIFYDLVARYRYKIFGKEMCELPIDPNYKEKFI